MRHLRLVALDVSLEEAYVAPLDQVVHAHLVRVGVEVRVGARVRVVRGCKGL